MDVMERCGFDTGGLLSFLDGSPTQFHAAENIALMLRNEGYERLAEDSHWRLVPGGRYYVVRNSSAIVAFAIPEKPVAGMPFRIVATHLDSPLLKLKFAGLRNSQNVECVSTEVYGGAILASWLDRPLGIAGKVVCVEDGIVNEKLVAIPDAAVVPNAAVHLNRDINSKGASYNEQCELNAILGKAGKDYDIAGICSGNLIDSELYLYDATMSALIGEQKQLLNAPRQDNLLSAYAAVRALCVSNIANAVPVAFFADNEEIGSRTMQGAASNMLPSVLRRIVLAMKGTEEDGLIALSGSRMISADAAHAAHPSYMRFYEPDYSPVLFGGVVLKKNAQFRYATDGVAAAEFRAMCQNAGIPCQDFINRADKPCGSTVGPALSSELGIRTVDIGVPMLAMHSIRETAALPDVAALQLSLEAFWN